MRRGIPCPPGASGHGPCRTCPASAARCPSPLLSSLLLLVLLPELSSLPRLLCSPWPWTRVHIFIGGAEQPTSVSTAWFASTRRFRRRHAQSSFQFHLTTLFGIPVCSRRAFIIGYIGLPIACYWVLTPLILFKKIRIVFILTIV
jgi:hypothetical protein